MRAINYIELYQLFIKLQQANIVMDKTLYYIFIGKFVIDLNNLP